MLFVWALNQSGYIAASKVDIDVLWTAFPIWSIRFRFNKRFVMMLKCICLLLLADLWVF